MEGKKPFKTFKVGGVKAALWENETKDGQGPRYSVTIDRAYKQAENWRHTNSFGMADLPKVQLVAAKAFEFLALDSEQEEK